MKLKGEDLVKKAWEHYKLARDAQSHWREEARELYRFRAGYQWSDEDVAYLNEQSRPPITFNRAGTIIDAVVGSEISNRQDIRFFPRTLDDAAGNEMATNVVKWIRDNCNAEDEESDSFEDVLICGMGWTETHVSYADDQDGMVIEERVDPLEMYWDPSSRKQNAEDRRWQLRIRWLDEDEIKHFWPHVGEITPGGENISDIESSIRDADPPYYENENPENDRTLKKKPVLHYQWCEYEDMHRILNPFNNKIEQVNGEQLKILKQRIPALRSATTKQKRHYQSFVCGATLLESGDAPVNAFTFKAITGKRDRHYNCWFGLMRGMKEPQEWANKFFSQILHIINSNSKGGFFFETGTLKDPQKAREDIARPDGMVELNPGKMNGIKERQMFQFPAGVDRMMEYAISTIRDVPGVNLEVLGMADRNQPGVLEAQRSRQAMVVLSPIFSALRRYRKEQGKLLLMFAGEYLADGRVIRIVGQEGEQYVRLLKDPLFAKFDVIVDQSPSSPNVKTEAWMALSQVLPVLRESGMPVPKEIVDVLPLPESLISKWKIQVKEGLVPPEIQKKMAELTQELQKLAEENQRLASKHEEKIAQMDLKFQMDLQKQKLETQGRQVELALEKEKIEQEAGLKMEVEKNKASMQFENLKAEIILKHQAMLEEMKIEREKMLEEAKIEREKMLKEMELLREKAKLEIELKEKTAQEDRKIQAMEKEDAKKAAKTEKPQDKQPIRDIVVNVDGKPKKFNIKRDKQGMMSEVEVQ